MRAEVCRLHCRKSIVSVTDGILASHSAPRIHGELMKLGINISEASVAKYMVRHPKPPSQTWRTFLNNHVSQLVSVDFFTVHTVWLWIGKSHGPGGPPPRMKISEVAVETATSEAGGMTEFRLVGRFLP